MDKTGLFLASHGNPTAMFTVTGVQVDLVRPEPGDINIRDISHHLSMLCRFNGAVERFYSIAEHSVRVADLAAVNGCRYIVQLAALLHDAHEAYTQDVIRPRKMYDEFMGSLVNSELEDRFQALVARVFELPTSMAVADSVKVFDNIMCRAECEQLTAHGGAGCDWGRTPVYNVELECWSQPVAKKMFFDRFGFLRDKLESRT